MLNVCFQPTPRSLCLHWPAPPPTTPGMTLGKEGKTRRGLSVRPRVRRCVRPASGGAAGDWEAGMVYSDNWVSFLLSLTIWMIVTPGSPSFLSVKWGCICSQEEYLPRSYRVPGVHSSQCWSHNSDRDRHVPVKRPSWEGRTTHTGKRAMGREGPVVPGEGCWVGS